MESGHETGLDESKVFKLPELTRWKEIVSPFFDVGDSNVEPGRDDAALVETSGQVDDDLAASVVVDNLELADVAVLHHDCEETGDDL